MFFDENYNRTTEDAGKPLYYNLRDVNERDGVYSTQNIQSPTEIALKAGITVEEATKAQQKQLEGLYKLRKHVVGAREVRLDITGVSRGVLNIRKEEGSTRIDDINFDASDIDLVIEIADTPREELGEASGGAYITIPGHRSILIQSDNLEVEEINRILDMVYNNKLKDEFGGTVPADKKIKLARHIIYKEELGGLQFYPRDNKTGVKVTLNGKEIKKQNQMLHWFVDRNYVKSVHIDIRRLIDGSRDVISLKIFLDHI